MDVRPLDVETYCKAVRGVSATHLKGIEISALLVAHSPSVNMTPVMHFQSSVWALTCLNVHDPE